MGMGDRKRNEWWDFLVLFKAVLNRKGEGGAWLLVAYYLESKPLFLKSGHGQVTIFL